MSTEFLSVTDPFTLTDSTNPIPSTPISADAPPTSLSFPTPVDTSVVPTHPTTHSTTQPTTTTVKTPTSTSSVLTDTTPSPTSTTVPSDPTTTWSPTTPPGSPTTITSIYITVVDGSTYTTQILVPSIIPTQPSSSDQRAAIIGGSAAGAAVFIIILVATIFYFRRKHFKRLRILDAIMSGRNQARQRAMLLAGEDFDDIDLYPPAGRYRDYETPWDAGSSQGTMSVRSFIPHGHTDQAPLPSPPISRTTTGPSLHQSHQLDTGPLIDPLLHSPESRVVDDVMGPSTSEEQKGRPSASQTSSLPS